ncbi:response regulator [bacterium]|nr:response regulator [bacterium]
MPVKVLIVDDNAMYRNAFKRNMMLQNYDVVEAENAEQAIGVYQESRPDVVVTDLSMGSPTEGLDLIRSIKQVEPLVPIVMISAVGTFEEGAEASRLGAHSVISKARIDEEIESLYRTIEEASQVGELNRNVRDEVQQLSGGPEGEVSQDRIDRLRQIIGNPKLHASVRGEAYDALLQATETEVRLSMEKEVEEADRAELEEAEQRLEELIPGFQSFSADSRKELCTAEYFFHRQGGDHVQGQADFSRNIGFSFCFAVENEAKSRLRKRLHKFLSNSDSVRLIRKLIDKKTGQLDLFYHQHLARLQQQVAFDFTIDNVRQVFQRILEHESRYKPDGLKALGIMVLCFGREYSIKTLRETIKINNPMNLRGFESENEIIRFAHLLVSLQHYRNPYIHPEISEMEKISKIRETAIQCLREISRLG